eukprot:1845299-Amphidinium_carterae.2
MLRSAKTHHIRALAIPMFRVLKLAKNQLFACSCGSPTCEVAYPTCMQPSKFVHGAAILAQLSRCSTDMIQHRVMVVLVVLASSRWNSI